MKKFQDLDNFSIEDVNAAIERNDPSELQLVSITVALACPDQIFAEETCLKLSAYPDKTVRGHALISLGHLARRFRKLSEDRVKKIIEAGLHEPDEYLRQYAKSAADEIHQFLGWNISGHQYG